MRPPFAFLIHMRWMDHGVGRMDGCMDRRGRTGLVNVIGSETAWRRGERGDEMREEGC